MQHYRSALQRIIGVMWRWMNGRAVEEVANTMNTIGKVGMGSRSMRRVGLGAIVLSAFVLVVAPTVALAASGWAVQPIPTPTGATQVTLNDVSCIAPTTCVGVGDYNTVSSSSLTLSERWTGTRWVVQHTPNPTGMAGAILNSVSCTSAMACTAVGYHVISSGHTLTLAEAWNGTKWTIQPTPNPTGTTNSVLTGVSCTSTSDCTAVGRYYRSSIVSLAEKWNGTIWVIQPTPNPTGDSVTEFLGVSCTSTAACTGVGFGLGSSNQSAMVAEAWNGVTWTIQSTPNPTGATSAVLRGISCTASTACSAVGDFIGSSSITTLAEIWNGAIWAAQPTPNPSGGTTNSFLTSISCASPTACTAIGFEMTSPGTVPLAEAWNGINWTIQPTQNPAGATQSYLYGVSCPPVKVCVAVGSTSSMSTAALVERHS